MHCTQCGCAAIISSGNTPCGIRAPIELNGHAMTTVNGWYQASPDIHEELGFCEEQMPPQAWWQLLLVDAGDAGVQQICQAQPI